jgi:hypothetical protein
LIGPAVVLIVLYCLRKTAVRKFFERVAFGHELNGIGASEILVVAMIIAVLVVRAIFGQTLFVASGIAVLAVRIAVLVVRAILGLAKRRGGSFRGSSSTSGASVPGRGE